MLVVMRVPSGRRSWLIIGFLVLAVAIIGGLFYYQRNQKTKDTTPRNERLESSISRTKQLNDISQTAFKQAYDKTKNVTTVAQLEASYPESEREANLKILVTRLVTEKNYTQALVFIQYTEQKYPNLAGTVDFEVMSYITAKGLSRADLMQKYKQKTEATLISQGVLKKGQTLPDSYFGEDK